MRTKIDSEVDIRGMREEERAQSVLRALGVPVAEGGFELVSEQDPRPFLTRLLDQRPGTFEWSLRQDGPEAWRVWIAHRGGEERTITGYLHRDHRRLDVLLEASRALLDEGARDQAADRFSEFKTGLVRHIRMEEEVLFPAFEGFTGIGRPGPIAVMLAEHVEILRLLDEMDGCLATPVPAAARFADLHRTLLGVLGEHNDKEEHVVYPLTDQALASDQREDLVHRMQSV